LEVERPELVVAHDDVGIARGRLGLSVGEVEVLGNSVLLRPEVGVVRLLPGLQRLTRDTLLVKERPESLVAVLDHPLRTRWSADLVSDQVANGSPWSVGRPRAIFLIAWRSTDDLGSSPSHDRSRSSSDDQEELPALLVGDLPLRRARPCPTLRDVPIRVVNAPLERCRSRHGRQLPASASFAQQMRGQRLEPLTPVEHVPFPVHGVREGLGQVPT